MKTTPKLSYLSDIRPYKPEWWVQVKVLHTRKQHSEFGETMEIIFADKKRNFFPRVKNLQVGQWRFIENFSVTPANGKYGPTSHKYKMSITGNSNVTNSELKIDDDFL
ncbi:unnamed protein product, partial [Brassica rapa subsp. trilocularis]